MFWCQYRGSSLTHPCTCTLYSCTHMFAYSRCTKCNSIYPPHPLPYQMALCVRPLACLQYGVSPYICFMCKLLLTALCQRPRGKTIWSKATTWLQRKQASVCPSLLINETGSAVVQRMDEHHSWLPLLKLFTLRWIPLEIQTRQTFLNPNAAPLCQLYASLLKDSAELLSGWGCHCFVRSRRHFSLLPKLLLKPR